MERNHSVEQKIKIKKEVLQLKKGDQHLNYFDNLMEFR